MNDKKPKPNLPVLKSYPDDVELILKFFAISDTFDDALECQAFKRRLDAIPNATQGVKMMNGRTLQMLYDLVATLPDDKKRSILRMSKHMKYKVYHATPASELGSGETVINTDDLNTLCKFAKQNCDVCFNGNCNNCELGKIFDSVFTYSRDKDESWATWEGWVKKDERKNR